MPSPTVTVDPTAAPPVATTPPAPPDAAPSAADLALQARAPFQLPRRPRRRARRRRRSRRALGGDGRAACATTSCSRRQPRRRHRRQRGARAAGALVVALRDLAGDRDRHHVRDRRRSRRHRARRWSASGAGLGLSLAATSNTQLTVGEAWTIITGLDYGTINGALWAGGLDLSDKGVVGAAVATSVAATSIGVLVASEKSPSAGDIEVVRSGLLWGTVGGALATFAIAPHDQQHRGVQGDRRVDGRRLSRRRRRSPSPSTCRATAC